MLEDDFNDCLGKAIRGTQFSRSVAGLDDLLQGSMNATLLREISPELGLNAGRLISLENYQPSVEVPSHLHTFTSSFGHLGVNSFVLETQNHFVIFDTGTNADECLGFLHSHPQKKRTLFITHNHPDHTACIHTLTETKNLGVFPAGEVLSFDNWTLTTLDVAGHMSPATAYLLKAENHTPICIVGDAIFAGSIGGCNPNNYKSALGLIKNNLLTLSPETILCTGHGPLTTVALELTHNPFF